MTSRRILIALAVLVLLAAGGTGAWLTLRHSHAAAAPTGAAGRTKTTPPKTTPPPSRSATATPARSPTASAGNGLVTVSPGVSRQAAEPQVVAFLGDYFAAINQHNYQRYSVLLGPRIRRAETAQVFHAGYRTTTDSAITLTGISAAAAGQLEAYVTFTSHQAAADSPSHSGCTDWSIILVLAPQHGNLVLEPPPAGYHASYRAC
jgi:hypothetical protein